MKTILKVEMTNGTNNISISNVWQENDPEMPLDQLVEINIGGFVDYHGGSDGESMFLTISEFGEFIKQCQTLQAYFIIDEIGKNIKV